jgi:hypothetical protein
VKNAQSYFRHESWQYSLLVYQIVRMGWHHQRRVHHCVMHIDIRDDKIWILHNTTEHELTIELMDLGVSKTDIVLGFCPPDWILMGLLGKLAVYLQKDALA